jgi:hypothetical protein
MVQVFSMLRDRTTGDAMNAPLLQAAPRSTTAPAVGVESFVVVREGQFGGRSFGVGDLVWCRGEARNGDDTVLVALGLGRPRFGARRNARWFGDAGEPCAPERWRSAGRVVGRSRNLGGGWVVELFQPDEFDQEQAAVAVVATRRADQLSLFAA